MLAQGFLSTGGASFIMFTHTKEMIERYLDALDQILAQINALAAQGRIAAEAGRVNVMSQFARLT
jgi:hypothetical protein